MCSMLGTFKGLNSAVAQELCSLVSMEQRTRDRFSRKFYAKQSNVGNRENLLSEAAL